ncbi:MAG: competence/damage-inducible protein A [Halodesulfurarchaeum sp.]
MDVAILTVGDELLSGQTENTNATWLADQLHGRGATVRRIVVVPDEEEAIVSSLDELSESFDAVIVTGGLGPTHDDVTMEAVATTFDREMSEHPDAATWIEHETEYDLRDLVPGTTHLPERAEFLPNPAGVAPGAHLENVYVLPGVPEEMRQMFALVAPAFDGPQSTTRVLTAERPERELVSALRAANERFDVSIGSYPGDLVTIRIQGLDPAEVEAAAAWLERRL